MQKCSFWQKRNRPLKTGKLYDAKVLEFRYVKTILNFWILIEICCARFARQRCDWFLNFFDGWNELIREKMIKFLLSVLLQVFFLPALCWTNFFGAPVLTSKCIFRVSWSFSTELFLPKKRENNDKNSMLIVFFSFFATTILSDHGN